MKTCPHCGQRVFDDVKTCPMCGNGVPSNNYYIPPYSSQYSNPTRPVQNKNSDIQEAAKVLLIVACITQGLAIFPLLWCLPMTIYYCDKLKKGEPVGIAFKICTILFSPIE